MLVEFESVKNKQVKRRALIPFGSEGHTHISNYPHFIPSPKEWRRNGGLKNELRFVSKR